MKQEKIVIQWEHGGKSITVNTRAEAAKKVKELLNEHAFITIENVSLKIEQAEK